MIKKIIQILQYVDQKKWIKTLFDYLIFGLLLYFISFFLIDFIKVLNRSSEEVGMWQKAFIIFVVVFYIFQVGQLIIQKVRSKSKEISFFNGVITRILPFLAGSFVIIIRLLDKANSVSSLLELMILYSLPLAVLYPVLSFLSFLHSKGWFKKVLIFSKQYNVFLVMFLPLVYFVAFIKNFFDAFYYIDVVGTALALLIVIFGFFIYVFFISIFHSTLETDLENPKDRSFKKILMVGFVIFLINLAPLGVQKGLDAFWEYNINRAQKILNNEGENQFGFKKVQDMWFLKDSFKNQYKDKGSRYSTSKKELFSKIYDDTLENSLKGELDIADFESRRSNATTSLSKDENAAVLLTFAQYNSFFYSDVNVLKTVVTYEFQNTEQSNQEVIFKIRLPKSESVVTDLKLGLNLEKQGLVAPRGAAERVYQESLLKNIDPALIAQIGVKEYKLRVFPVTSKTDNRTQGRQKVQFTYLTPISSQDEIILAPKIETLNLSIEEKTKAFVRLRRENRLIKEFTVTENKEDFFSNAQSFHEDFKVTDRKFCTAIFDQEKYLSQYILDKKEKNNQVAIFFDISRSAGRKKNIKEIYEQVYNAFRDESLPFEAYFYNFAVYPAVPEFNDSQFFGYTDTIKVIEYLNENEISGKDILIVSDDTNFEFTKSENKSINYKKLASNTISVLQVGAGVRAHKDEITKAVLASGGEFIVVDEVSDVVKKRTDLLNKDPRLIFDNCLNISGMNNEDLIEKVQMHDLSNLLLSNISNESSWQKIGQVSGDLAKKYQFVNLFSSFIALETARQARDLERYSSEQGSFDVDYSNDSYQQRSSFSSTRNKPWGTSNSWTSGMDFSATDSLSLEVSSVEDDKGLGSLGASNFRMSIIGIGLIAVGITAAIIGVVRFIRFFRKKKDR